MKSFIYVIAILSFFSFVKSQDCSYVYNVDYFGKDLLERIVATVGECCTLCQTTAQCTAWTFLPINGKCFLKYGIGEERSVSPGPLFSGIVKKYATSSTTTILQTTTATQQNACAIMGNFDYIGNDLTTLGQVVNSIDECCDLCSKNLACKAWSYLKYSNWNYGKCYLKSAIGDKYTNQTEGRTILSGVVIR